MWGVDVVLLQPAKIASSPGPDPPKPRLANSDARTGRRARPVRERVGDERTGRSTQDRSGALARTERTEDRRRERHSVFVETLSGMSPARRRKVRLGQSKC